MGLGKYENLASLDLLSGERPVSWNLAKDTGVPYVGDKNVILTRQEIEEMPQHLDAQVKTFDLANTTERAEYNVILDRVCNGLYTLLFRQHMPYAVETVDGPVTRKDMYMKVYIEWALKYVSPDRKMLYDNSHK